MGERTSVLLIVIGLALVVVACAAYALVAGLPEVRLPTSTPFTARTAVAGVWVAGAGVWLLAWAAGAIRQRHKTSVVGNPVHGGRTAAAPVLGIAAAPAATTLPLRRLDGDGMSVAGHRAGRVCFPPDAPGRPTPTLPTSVSSLAPQRRVAGASRRGCEAPALYSRPCPVRGEHGRAVAASAWNPDVATTQAFDLPTWTARDAEVSGITGLDEITN